MKSDNVVEALTVMSGSTDKRKSLQRSDLDKFFENDQGLPPPVRLRFVSFRFVMVFRAAGDSPSSEGRSSAPSLKTKNDPDSSNLALLAR